MKLLWLSHLLPFPPKGGAAQRSYHLIRILSKYYDIDLVSFNQKQILKNDSQISIARAEFNKLCKNVYIFDIPCDFMFNGKVILAIKSLFSSLPYSINWLESKNVHLFIRNKIQSSHYDFVWFDTISLASYGKYFSEQKTILNHHNIESDMMFRRSKNESNLIKKLYYHVEAVKLKQVEVCYCNRFTINIVCSDLDRIRLQKILPELNVKIIPNGVDTDYFNSCEWSQKPLSLIFAGTLSWYPNRAAMIFFIEKIWPILKIRIPDVKMTIIGKDPPERLLQEAKHDSRLIVTGFVDDVRPFIEAASVYVCPIMDGGGTKLKILDALAMKKAIVADPIACEGIDVFDGETVLFAKTPEQFVDKIEQLFSNEALRKSMGIKGRNLIENQYSYDRIGETLISEMRNVSAVSQGACLS